MEKLLAITKEQMLDMPSAIYKGRPIVVDTAAGCRSAVAYLRKQKLLGFDTETRPTFRKGGMNKPALLQVATEDECFLFRINKTGITEEIAALFESPDVMKIGLSIKDDLHQMHTLRQFEPANIVELQTYVKNFGIIDNALQKVYAIVFGERMSKGQRLTNWEADKLTEQQQMYAALDADACLRLYKHLEAGKFNPEACKYIASEEMLIQRGIIHHDTKD